MKNPIKSIKEITVIESISVIGEGTEDNPMRHITQYWSKDGELLAERDEKKSGD